MFFLHKNKSTKRHAHYSKGMTYVELIVVLSIFAVISSVSLFNYRKFEEKVDMKSLANDIALKIVEAQKNSTSGVLPLSPKAAVVPWKPSYGVYFNTVQTAFAKAFDFFVDLNQDKQQTGSALCTPINSPSLDCMKKINIPAGSKSASIVRLQAFYINPNDPPTVHSDMHITFTRPDSVATFYSADAFTSAVSYVQIDLSSPQGVTANIKVYASGRIQIN